MPERDYVDQDYRLGYTGVFDCDDFYKTLYRWFRKNGYTWKEVDCRDYKEDGKRKCFIKWEAEKEVSDYVKYKMETEIRIDNISDVMSGKKKKMKGTLVVKMNAYTLSDYEESWTRSSILKFIKEVSDKYIAGSKLQKMQKDLKDELHNLMAEIKAHFNLIQLGK